MTEDSSEKERRSVGPNRPWLGLRPFRESHAPYFFGRNAETIELFKRVRDNSLTLLFGQSGMGKSSLLGSGLIPKLRIEGYRPIPILSLIHI